MPCRTCLGRVQHGQYVWVPTGSHRGRDQEAGLTWGPAAECTTLTWEEQTPAESCWTKSQFQQSLNRQGVGWLRPAAHLASRTWRVGCWRVKHGAPQHGAEGAVGGGSCDVDLRERKTR